MVLLSILFGLLAAASWGGGDFLGGLVSRRLGVVFTVFLSESIGLAFLLVLLPLAGEPAPSIFSVAVSLAAGVGGTMGLILLYRAMAGGTMSIAAPISAVLSAGVPVVIGTLLEGPPGTAQTVGLLAALAAVWLISQSEVDLRAFSARMKDLVLPLLARLCFGLYFVLLHEGAQDTILWSLLLARCMGTLVLLGVLLARRMALRPAVGLWKLVLLNALLDVGGSLFYVLAGQAGRMDVAAVLSALYPGGTVLLARIFLKEKTNRLQAVGILAALVAIVLMTV